MHISAWYFSRSHEYLNKSLFTVPSEVYATIIQEEETEENMLIDLFSFASFPSDFQSKLDSNESKLGLKDNFKMIQFIINKLLYKK